MTLFRPSITFLAIFSLFTILFSSCTITQRRYRSGFHLEWKHRYKAQESDQKTAEKAEAAVVEQPDADEVVSTDPTVRPVEVTPVVIQPESTPQPQIVYHPFPLGKIVPTDLAVQNDEVNRDNKLEIVAKKSIRQSRKDQTGWLIALGILFGIAVLAMPPLLFSVGAYWLDVTALELTLIWILWIGGIVGVFLLFSGLWPLILSCLIWNIIFTIAAFTLTVT